MGCSVCFGELLDGGEDGVEFRAVEELAAEDYGADFLGVANVAEGVGIEEEEIGELAWLDGALRLGFAEEFGGLFCCGLQGLHGCEACLHQEGEFFVEAGAREDVRGGGVCAGQDADACSMHFSYDVQRCLHEAVAKSELLWCSALVAILRAFLPIFQNMSWDVFSAWVARGIGFGRGERVVAEKNQRGDLPGVIVKKFLD